MSPSGKVKEQRVVSREEVFDHLARIRGRYGPFRLVIGDRTGSKEFLADLEQNPVRGDIPEIHKVDEHLSTLEARHRYFVDNPPKGLKRLIPRTMLTPPVPIDDYVAVILAERYLKTAHSL